MKKCIALTLGFLVAISIGSPKILAVNVSAQGAVVMNLATGSILYEKNAHTRLPMASTTKIMTALLLIENAILTDEIIATREMVTVEGSSMGLLEGDSVSYYALLCGMLLPSGNDAANTAAISIAGSIKNFADMMNQKAAELGMVNSHFETPSGLDAETHYSTAYDMAILAKAAMGKPVFREVAASKSATVSFGNPPYKRTLFNHNKLLNLYNGATGIKTGFTKKSGRCLVSSAEYDGKAIIAVTLNAPSDWEDHAQMFDYGFSQLETVEFSSLVDGIDIKVVGGTKSKTELVADKAKLGLTPEEKTRIQTIVKLDRFYYAPVSEGQVVGWVELRLKDELIGYSYIRTKSAVELIEAIPKTFLQKYLMIFKQLINMAYSI